MVRKACRPKIKRAYIRVAPGGSRQPRTVEELLERVIVCPSGCWLWTGADDGYGDHLGRGAYGRILRPGTRVMMPAHRYVHELLKGPIPDGFDVDHLCAEWASDPRLVRRCVNPDHLEAVTPALNQQRKLLRRLGYLTEDMDFENAPTIERPQPDPLLAPGERLEDIVL
jgi:hypothetical protein